VRLYGGPAAYFRATDREVLLEGGVRTGKSNAAMLKAHVGCTQYPGLQVLFTRETRKSLSTTILPDFERFILGREHEAISGTAKPENRTSYRYPNGSQIDLIGMDDPGKVLSGQWDWIFWFQAERGDVKSWKMLLTRLSETNGPYNQITADVNPAERRNWANVRGDQWVCPGCGEVSDEKGTCPTCHARMKKIMRRIKTTQQDNPKLFNHHQCRDCGIVDPEHSIRACWSCGSKNVGAWTPFGAEYMSGLHMLTGVERERYLNHKWVSAEGLIFTEYQYDLHHVALGLDGPTDHHRRTAIEQPDGSKRYVLDFDDYFATIDYGYVDPTCLCIWGVIGQQLYRIWEGYMTGEEIARRTKVGGSAMDFWVEKLAEVDEEVGGLDSILVSHEKRELMDKLNERLVDGRRHVKAPAILTPYRGKDVGIDSVKRHLRPAHGGRPDVFLCHDAHRWGLESNRKKANLPMSMEEEIESFVWMDPEKTVLDKDKPDPDQEDHAMDNLQWACLWHEHVGADDWARQPNAPDLGEDILGIRETLMEVQRG